MYFTILLKDEKNETWRSCTVWWFYQHPFPFFWQTVPLPQSTHSPCGLGRAPCTTAEPRQIITPPEQLLPGQVRDISGFKASDSWVFMGPLAWEFLSLPLDSKGGRVILGNKQTQRWRKSIHLRGLRAESSCAPCHAILEWLFISAVLVC